MPVGGRLAGKSVDAAPSFLGLKREDEPRVSSRTPRDMENFPVETMWIGTENSWWVSNQMLR